MTTKKVNEKPLATVGSLINYIGRSNIVASDAYKDYDGLDAINVGASLRKAGLAFTKVGDVYFLD